MTLATLKDVLQPALNEGYAVAGLVCLGWEDSRAYVHAAQDAGLPVILQAGPGCRAHTPLPVLASMFRWLAESVDIPVVVHLDHGQNTDECRQAIDCGFTSVMYDGSRLSLEENIDTTAQVVELAHKAGVSCEGEIGFVGYDNAEASARTAPDDARKFANSTGVDAMAISIGNVHLQQDKKADIDLNALQAIESVCSVPLVIHGGSGVSSDTRTLLARSSNICKFNIGTELRMTFGSQLRETIAADPSVFDRITILKNTEAPLRDHAREIIASLGPANRV